MPASTTAVLPCSEPAALATSATPAAAVVFEPFESSMQETRNGPKKRFFTAANTASPSAMEPPPTKIAVDFFSEPPRV